MRKRNYALLAAVAAVLLMTACSPLHVLNALAESAASATTDIAYGSDPRQKLDVYAPTGRKGPFPVVLFFFGGSWNTGDRADYKFVAEAMAARGMMVVVADYRLYPQVRYPEFLEDAAAAAAWTVANARSHGGNPERIHVMGHSAGAYNAAMLALDPRWMTKAGSSPQVFAGFIGLAGPYDFLPIENPDVKPVFFHPNSPPDSQPILYAGTGSPRSFLAAPGNDKLVNPERNSRQLAEKLTAAGVAVTFKQYSNVNHVTIVGAMGRPLRWMAPVLEDVVAFIRGGS